MFNWKRLVIFVALLLIVAVPVFVMAQDVTPVPPDEAANRLLTDIVSIIVSWGAIVGAAGAILVGFAKYIPGLNQLPGATLSVVVNGLLMVGYWAAQHFNLLPQYQLGLGQIETIGTALLALVSAILGSGLIHTQAARGKIPVVGYERTPSIK